jgi:3-methyladenine DNA glycosylase AlkD
VLDKDGWLDRHRRGDLAVDTFAWVEAGVRLSGNTAVAAGTQSQVARFRGRDCSGAFAATLVAVRRHDRWTIVNLQLSARPNPAGGCHVSRRPDVPIDLSARRFIEELGPRAQPANRAGYERSFKYAEGDEFLGVPMGQVFALTAQFVAMTPDEIERLLKSPIHEARVGALSVMDKQARRRRTPEDRRRELFELYLRRSDRIDNWDLVDLAAPHVVGGYLFDKPRDVLYELARSESPWERRTAIVSTSYFIRQGDLADTFRIAEILVRDGHDLVQKAVGGWVREAGKRDRPRLLAFLDEHAATMGRAALRHGVEHLDRAERDHYLGLRKIGQPPAPESAIRSMFGSGPGATLRSGARRVRRRATTDIQVEEHR